MIVLRFFLLSVIGLASVAAETIHLKTRDFQPPADVTEYLSRPVQRRTAATSHYLVQFEKPVNQELIERLRAHGMVVTSYVGRSTLMIAAPDNFSLSGLAVRWIGRLEHQDKISPRITEQLASGHAPAGYVVEFHPDVNMDEARAMVREHNLRLIENRYLASHHLLVEGGFSAVSRLAEWDEVAYIFPPSPELLAGTPVYACESNGTETGTTGQYVGTGYPWDVTGTGPLTLGYYFSQLTQELPSNASEQQILRAFNEWAKYANVSFTSASSATAPQTVNVLFATGAHGDAYPFEGSTILAHTFYPAPLNPEPIAGDMHLNNDERWQIGADIDLYSVALHEAGHSLGLVHVDDPNQVMYPYYRMRTTLGSGDISVVQSYYGAAAGYSASQPSQPAPLALTVQSPAATSTTTSSSIAVSGITTGGVAPVVVAWATASGEIGNALGSANWTIPAIPLTLGVNNITITAFDAASHITTQTISVTEEAQPASAPGNPVSPSTPNTPSSPNAPVSPFSPNTPSNPSSPSSPSGPSSPSSPNPPSTPQTGSPHDTTPPSLTITNPASTIVSTTASSITFQGMASDNVGVSSVVWSTSTGSSGTATGTLTWTAANIPLLIGTNTVTLRAYDAAGNSAWRSATVVYTGN